MKIIKDQYYKKAKQENYAARSVYKLQEIQEKHHVIHQGNHVLDLGCSPGSWMQLASKIVGEKGKVYGIDLKPVSISLSNNMLALEGDINEFDFSQVLEEKKLDVIISDMAPKTTGIKSVDADRSYHLCQMSLLCAQKWLKDHGNLLVKFFQGSKQNDFLNEMKENFSKVKIVKPKSSRNESVEIFILGLGKLKHDDHTLR